jgi:hypothetical protein
VHDVLTTGLELAFVALTATGLALVVVALVGGLLGVGLGLAAAGLLILAVAEVARYLHTRTTTKGGEES